MKTKVVDPSRRLASFTTSYANHIVVEFTKLDLTLVFAQITQTQTEPDIHISAEEYGAVKMSLAQAKILAILLAVNVSNLETEEEEIGTIRIPKGIVANLVPDDLTRQPLMEILKHIIDQKSKGEAAAVIGDLTPITN